MSTNFQNGVASYGIPVLGSGSNFPIPNSGGKTWFVSSVVGSNGFDGSYKSPFGTLAFAAAYTNVQTGDIIIVLPGHTETVSTDGGIVIPSGVRVFGQGNADGRPTLTFGTVVNASIQFANGGMASIDNFVGQTTLASTLARPITITSNNNDTTISNFTWHDSTGFEAVRVISANNVDDLTIYNYRHEGLANGTVQVSAILLNNVSETEVNLDYWGNNSIAAVELAGRASQNIRVTGSVYVNGISNSAQIIRDYITSAPSTWSAYVFDGYAGTYVSGSSATGNGATGIIATGSGTAVSSNVNNIMSNTVNLVANMALAIANVQTVNATVGTINTNVTSVLSNTNNIMANTTYLIAMEERTISTGTSSSFLNAAATSNVFTVTGGPILVRDIICVCTASGTSSNTNLAFQINAVSGGVTSISNNSANATTVTAGTIYSLPATFAANTLTNASGVHIAIPPIGGIVCPVGTIQANVINAITGTYYFSMRYLPLHSASVVANTVI